MTGRGLRGALAGLLVLAAVPAYAGFGDPLPDGMGGLIA